MSSIDPRPVALIFRKRLLPYSETFVAAQAHALRTFRPVFTGFHPDRRGLHHLQPDECELLATTRWRAELQRWRMRWRNEIPTSWLRRLRLHQPRLMHAHFGADGHAALPLARALGVPLITTFHGHDVLGVGERREARNRELFASATAVIAVSRFLERRLVKAGCPPGKILQHYIGIDTRLFRPPPVRAPEPTVLFVGRLVSSKGCQDAIEAVAVVQEQLPSVRLVIVGDGPQRRDLERQASARLRHCRFTGAIAPAEVLQEMQDAWVLCGPRRTLPSGYAEALGMVFLEAQACGLPVVGYRNGGVAETVREGETALLSAEGDLKQLARDLHAVLGDAALRQRLSAGAVAHVLEHFDLRRQTAILEDHYGRWMAAGSATGR